MSCLLLSDMYMYMQCFLWSVTYISSIVFKSFIAQICSFTLCSVPGMVNKDQANGDSTTYVHEVGGFFYMLSVMTTSQLFYCIAVTSI